MNGRAGFVRSRRSECCRNLWVSLARSAIGIDCSCRNLFLRQNPFLLPLVVVRIVRSRKTYSRAVRSDLGFPPEKVNSRNSNSRGLFSWRRRTIVDLGIGPDSGPGPQEVDLGLDLLWTWIANWAYCFVS
ncbi:hypothetical protein Droror1_Dr00006482 [Drosera rotundifolia]